MNDTAHGPFRAFFTGLRYCENTIALVLTAGLLLIPVIQILQRSLGLESWLWGDQVSRLLVLWIAMFGAMLATRAPKHIAIDFSEQLHNPRLRFASQLINHLVTIVVGGILTYTSAALVITDYQDDVDAFLSVPLWAAESIIPVTFAIITLRYCGHLLQLLTTKGMRSAG